MTGTYLAAAAQGTTTSSSPPRKANRQQSGIEVFEHTKLAPSSGVSAAGTAPTIPTSPLTITSLEQATAAGMAEAVRANDNTASAVLAEQPFAAVGEEGGVPAVVDPDTIAQPLPGEQLPVDAMLGASMTKLQLVDIAPQAHDTVPVVMDGSKQAATVVAVRPIPNRDTLFRPYYNNQNSPSARKPATQLDQRKLFVGGLPMNVSGEEFLDFFSQFGQVIDSVVMVDRDTGRSRGFGFVTYANEADAAALLTTNPGHTGHVLIGGKQVEIKASTPKVDDGRENYPRQRGSPGGGGTPGMWKSHPPLMQQSQLSAPRPVPVRGAFGGNGSGATVLPRVYHQQHLTPQGNKQFYMEDGFVGDVDGRNFNDIQSAPDQGGGRYTNPVYYQQSYQYQNVYGAPVPTPAGGAGGYNASTGSNGSTNSGGYDANQAYGQYPSNNVNGYYDPYAQQYPNQYEQYQVGNQPMPPQAYQGAGDSNVSYNNGYCVAEGGDGTSAQGGGGYEYPQGYAVDQQDGGYASAEKYE